MLVADIDPAKPEASSLHSLDCTFTTEAHTKLAPLATTVTVIGLNRANRKALLQQQKAASEKSWKEYQKLVTGAVVVVDDNEQIFQAQSKLVFDGLQVKIEAGYQDDFGLIANAQTLPDGIKHDETGPPTTTLRAQDGRYPWQNGFVSEEVAPGVTYRDMDLVQALSQGYLEGDVGAEQINAKVPELLARKDFAGYANGRVLSGNTRDQEKRMAETLGLKLFWDRGRRVYLDVDAVTQDEAVVLKYVGKKRIADQTPTPGGLLSWQEGSRGMMDARCLLNYRLTPGRPVFLRDANNKPIGEGTFRVEHVRHSGAVKAVTYYSDVLLRPTKIPTKVNV